MSAAPNLHLHPVLENVLMLNLSNGVDETLRTMAHASCIFERSFSAINWQSPCEYTVYLDIKSATTQGQVRIHAPFNVLAKLFQILIGDDSPPTKSDAVDILGELSNVSYGIAKGRLNREGYSLGMALPHAGKSTDIPPLISDRPNMIIPFNVFNETCYIHILIL